VNEVLPPDIRKTEEKGIDEYLSEGFNLIITNPKILIPFTVPLVVSIFYGVYLLENLFRGRIFAFSMISEISQLTWRQFLMISAFAVTVIVVFMLWGIEVIAYFVVKKRDVSDAMRYGIKRLPITFVNYTVLLAIIFAFFAPIVVVRSLWFVLLYSFLVAILVSPLVFLLSPVIVEKTFGIVDAFVLYKRTFKKSLILGLLYSLVSSAVSSLIPVIGGALNTIIVVPGFIAVYSLLYTDYKKIRN